MKIPSFNEYILEGALTNYRTEREGMKITYSQMEGSFDEILKKLIDEKIPFYFDCNFKNFTRFGFLMNETINNVHFNGYILNSDKNKDEIYNDLTSILKDIVIDKQNGKLHVGRSNFCDLTKASDIDTISVVVKAFKQYGKEKSNLEKRVITGNKYECNINIDFLCDKSKTHDIIDFVF